MGLKEDWALDYRVARHRPDSERGPESSETLGTAASGCMSELGDYIEMKRD